MDVCNLNAPLCQYCACNCHKPWLSIVPPLCNCNCNKQTYSTSASIPISYMAKTKSKNDKDLFEILKKLEKLLINLENDIKELLPSRNRQINNKRPYKCPICNGSIKIYIDPKEYMSGIESMFGKKDINGMYYKDCNSCDKKGIVWG